MSEWSTAWQITDRFGAACIDVCVAVQQFLSTGEGRRQHGVVKQPHFVRWLWHNSHRVRVVSFDCTDNLRPLRKVWVALLRRLIKRGGAPLSLPQLLSHCHSGTRVPVGGCSGPPPGVHERFKPIEHKDKKPCSSTSTVRYKSTVL